MYQASFRYLVYISKQNKDICPYGALSFWQGEAHKKQINKLYSIFRNPHTMKKEENVEDRIEIEGSMVWFSMNNKYQYCFQYLAYCFSYRFCKIHGK